MPTGLSLDPSECMPYTEPFKNCNWVILIDIWFVVVFTICEARVPLLVSKLKTPSLLSSVVYQRLPLVST